MGREHFPTFLSFTKVFPIQRSDVCGKEKVAVDQEIIKKNKITFDVLLTVYYYVLQ
jgi:hypothetical protein